MIVGFSTRFCRKCLALSFSVDQMNRFAKLTNTNYDLHKSYGFSKGHPIGIHEAADRIVGDMVQIGFYLGTPFGRRRAANGGFKAGYCG
jgi:hypothetical protein